MRKEYKVLLFLFLVSLIVRILFVFSGNVRYWDETVYANLGYGLSKNPFDYSFANNGWSDFTPGDWPKAGYKAPLLPYTLAVLYFLKLGSLTEFLMPVIGALSIIVLFVLCKKMFNKNIALYSAALLSFLPLHVFYSGKILTDVFSTFFIILTVLFFWEGFEEKKIKSKLLFGVFLALSVLARYTILWMVPVFLFYLILRNRNFSFLKDKFLWMSIGLFFITLSPWFIYSIMTYGNPLGAFVHGMKAVSYWGGVQPWYFYLSNSFSMFSILPIVFLASLFFIFIKKIGKSYAAMFLLLWFLVFFAFASLTSHKEDRFLLPLVPPFVIISALSLGNLRKKNLILILITLALVFH